jgi:E3 ubiquitin-protein ligase RNF19A
VSLCRAGCGVSTSRDGVKFEFDEDEEVGRNHDAQSVDAVSRIGATSIGEVSLSVASGSHLGGGHNHTARESTTALAGSISGSSAGHKLEVQADISETASAVTCVSEKSGNNGHDTASTKALAGSILNYKQVNCDQSLIASEDGTSERVRFDNMIYVCDGQKDGECWYTAPLDQVRLKVFPLTT